MGSLTTHVLDVARGVPAAGVAVDLHRGAPAPGADPLVSAVTDADGRTPAPLLDGAAMQVGIYTLLFHVGPYFRDSRVPLANPPFLDTVPVAFAIADVDAHYHVPLLVSPWGYTTYRGS
jgi:5-hydroxyisourate hydrolase